jgi:hypothetical protein
VPQTGEEQLRQYQLTTLGHLGYSLLLLLCLVGWLYNPLVLPVLVTMEVYGRPSSLKTNFVIHVNQVAQEI